MPTRATNHRPAHQPARTHDADGTRGSSAARGYGRHWRKVRLAILGAEPLCRGYPAPGQCDRLAEHVDHIVSKAAGGTNDPGNLQPLCATCHQRKTNTEEGGAYGRSRGR